jgi:nicotinamide riboside kinase
MKDKPKLIVITGAESTGKSALTEWLAGYFKVPLIPEFARSYIENLNRKYTYQDVEIIAGMQVKQLREFLSQNHTCIFSDTWLIITLIWFQEVFKVTPSWLEQEIISTNIDLFLVCDTDLPWVPDHVRENGGEKRLYLQKRYIDTIEKYGFQYKIVQGTNNIRNQNALHFIEETGIVKPNRI